MKTFKEFMDEAVSPSLVRATARTTMQNAALRNAGRELPKSSTAPKTASFTKLYHGTTKPASQAIDKSGWKTDTNVTRQMQGSGVYTTPQKGAAQMYANQRSLARGEKPAVRTFNLPTDKFNAVKANRQSTGTWTLNKGGNKFNVMQMSPKAANKYDVTNKPQSAINVKGPQKAEVRGRVGTAFQKPQNVKALKTQLGLKPKGGGNSAQDVTDDPNSKPIAARSRNYTIGGGQGYGIAGIKLADSYDAEVNQVQELFGFMEPPKPKPPNQVLAYQNYKPGVLNKDTGKFTQRAHTGAEQKRYGWKPVQVSSYSKADTPGPKTSSGHKFDDNQRLVAVPYKYKQGQVPKGEWKGTPSTPFGTKLDLTAKPMGTSTKVAKTSVQDTGNFGAAGDTNKNVKMDLSLRTAKDIAPVSTSNEFGKRMVYSRVSPPASK